MENFMTSALLEKIFEIENPWFIDSIKTDLDKKEIDIFIKYQKGSLFVCSDEDCNNNCKIHDGSFRRWRHLDIVDFRCYLNVKVPRTNCKEHGIRTLASLPWMRMQTHYSFKFEAALLRDIREMSMSAISRKLGEPDNNLWRSFNFYIEKAIDEQINLSNIKSICVDEKSSSRGHKYVTIFSDYDTGNVLYVIEGREKDVFDKFKDWFYLKGGNPRNLSFISMDMSKSYQAGALQFFPRSEIVFDRFHIKMGINKKLNEVKKKETSENEILKKTKYLWVSNLETLNDNNQEKLKTILLNTSLKTVKAYQLKCQFDELWNVPDLAVYPALDAWIENAFDSKIPQIIQFTKSVLMNFRGIANSMITKISNGVAEGINSVVQLVKSRARGFRKLQNFINMIYFNANDFKFSI
jgi:transposase